MIDFTIEPTFRERNTVTILKVNQTEQQMTAYIETDFIPSTDLV